MKSKLNNNPDIIIDANNPAKYNSLTEILNSSQFSKLLI